MRSPRLRLPLLLLAIAAIAATPVQRTSGPRGFTQQSASAQREWEGKFRAMPDRMLIRSYVERLAARPHHVGSPYGKTNAEWMRDQFRSWGWDAELAEYHVLFPTPKERVVELVAPTRFVAKLEEPAIASDPTSSQKSEQLPSYNAYSADGDVTGPLVYVNYGVPADYEELERLGINVRGAIVIARYGGSWRGIKPKVAAEHGAIGCIIYSDPRDDGYYNGDVYPVGPWRPKDGVQRGSVLDMPVAPGDPLTIGTGATRDAQRIDRANAATLMKIPVLPISYGDAQPLLAALGGPVAPQAWRGALPITYKLGPGPARVHVKLTFNWNLAPVYNVIARLQGSEFPDQWIVRGNHHDGWVNGAEDPIAGMAPELEEARALGELVKQGWRPKRTIVYAAWDAEEPALLGSTEWAEHHDEELRRKAAVYINTDGNGRGYLGVGGSHSLERFANEVAKDIEDPESKVSVWKRLQARIVRDAQGTARREARERADLRIEALGSGSDFTPFLQHLGIASLNLGYGGSDGGGIYHSIYDDFAWYTRFSDTSFVYGRALAQTVGTMVMRLANADVLPYEFGNLAETARGYVTEVKGVRDDMAQRIAEKNRQIDDRVFEVTQDPKVKEVLPTKEPLPPVLNFAPLDNAVDSLTRAAAKYESALGKALGGSETSDGAAASLDPAALKTLNDQLIQVERMLTSPDGLPKRPWYRHLVYAPGLYTGYGVKTLPGAREAIELKAWSDAEREIGRIANAFNRTAAHILDAAKQLEGAVR
ncbi:MAG TPA: transferrin receptor-like dimerization domain-containing protein [Gemmatimonadaceae bacterium]|jgi:N-acetylated-alpha-linked acidic dipeptidase